MNIFVTEAKDLWKAYSVWVFAAIGAFPDAYNGIASMGWADEIPMTAKWILRSLAGLGLFLRFVNQRKRENANPGE